MLHILLARAVHASNGLSQLLRKTLRELTEHLSIFPSDLLRRLFDCIVYIGHARCRGDRGLRDCFVFCQLCHALSYELIPLVVPHSLFYHLTPKLLGLPL